MNRRMFLAALSTTLAAGTLVRADSEPGVTIETTSGKIRGGRENGIFTFKGVPYGANTAGRMRFLPPAPPAPWTSVRDAIAYGPMSPQVVAGAADEANLARTAAPYSEDCLVLNVWTPGTQTSARRPVMFWCHGGGYTTGSGSSPAYDGGNLSKRGDVVVVSINHRLNVFGYLHLGDVLGEAYRSSGNAGMLDIVAALQWVRANIGRFGGDASNVTIFGQSGGARKVSTLLAMPAAKGLFHKAIIQSGATLRANPGDLATDLTLELLSALGLKEREAAKLHDVPAARLVAAFNTVDTRFDLAGRQRGVYYQSGFGPTIDGAVLTGHPFDPAAPAVSKDVPLMLGNNKHESAMLLRPDKRIAERTLTEEELRARTTVMAGTSADRVLTLYSRQYPGASPAERYVLMTTHRAYGFDSVTVADRKHAQRGAPVYVYEFDWQAPSGAPGIMAHHGLEITFVFDNVARVPGPTGGGADARALAAKMSAAWLAFARTGNPSTPTLPPWPAYRSDVRSMMLFNKMCRVAENPLGPERQLWATI